MKRLFFPVPPLAMVMKPKIMIIIVIKNTGMSKQVAQFVSFPAILLLKILQSHLENIKSWFSDPVHFRISSAFTY